ncbi:hypothetical protein A3Q56_01755 [Intoshia linei]|uniref:Uncharacterized protein n=1 Tax=Intoshia linei TaxID=1819745 RepID=A0A177B887_9BILA|nr:hypothetical protein A3Q56_01755 [Intoshia linei]
MENNQESNLEPISYESIVKSVKNDVVSMMYAFGDTKEYHEETEMLLIELMVEFVRNLVYPEMSKNWKEE